AAEVVHFFRAEAHDAASGGVRGNRVVPEQEHASVLGISLNWAIPFHSEDAIHDDEIGASGGVDIEDGTVDASPVENVFRPAIATSRDDAEKVFHRESDTRPVMRLELGHGDKEVRAENRFGKIQLL